jgi:hypothetical protein
MAAPHYTPSGDPVQGTAGSSAEFRTEFGLIETGIQVLNAIPVIGFMSDANTLGQIYIPVPWACRLIKIYAVNSIVNTTTATILTPKIGGTAVTDGGMTFGATDAVGTILSATPTALNTIAEGQALEIETDGGGTPVMPVNITLLVERT